MPINYMPKLNQIAKTKGLGGNFTSRLAIAATSLLNKAGLVTIDPDDLAGTHRTLSNALGVTAYAADGAITARTDNVALTKGTAGAYTLATPSVDGLMLRITSGSAAAHVVTATGLINNGVTGGSKNTATFAAFAGASIALMSYGGKWNVIGSNNVTIA